MAQDKDYKTITTIIYVSGDSPAERKDDLRTCLKHATHHTGETWLTEPSLTKNTDNATEAIENETPGNSVTIEEGDWHPPINQLLICHDKTTTKNGLDGMMQGATKSNQPYSLIVVHPDELIDRANGAERIQELVDCAVDVHLAEAGMVVTSGTAIKGATKRALTTLSDALHPSHDHDTDATYAWSGGRPPLGFEVDGGRLVETDEYDRICTVLQQVRDSETSKRRAAKRLGCSRGTIINALEDRPSMYGLV
ncbi:hypothetical protein [Halorhabdus tiamatea]|nr:hypothetical protein [Halorhabdus tiamatea]